VNPEESAAKLVSTLLKGKLLSVIRVLRIQEHPGAMDVGMTPPTDSNKVPTVSSYSGRPSRSSVDDPAKSVRKPPGSMMVTPTPRGPTSFASVSEKPSTPHFAAASSGETPR
jgi:hypothetical protein